MYLVEKKKKKHYHKRKVKLLNCYGLFCGKHNFNRFFFIYLFIGERDREWNDHFSFVSLQCNTAVKFFCVRNFFNGMFDCFWNKTKSIGEEFNWMKLFLCVYVWVQIVDDQFMLILIYTVWYLFYLLIPLRKTIIRYITF